MGKAVLTLFGTRPEIVKLAPVLRELDAVTDRIRTVNVCSSQHTDLLGPFVELFGVRIDHDLHVMRVSQTPAGVCRRVLGAIEPVFEATRPDLVLVQGDTTTTLAGALAAFYHGIPVGHVEAGLRTGNVRSPFPEEMNRVVVGRLARLHFAATERNRETLLAEGVPDARIFRTGNPVVDSIQWVLEHHSPSPELEDLLERIGSKRILALTSHRRESFGETMRRNLKVIGGFVSRHEDLALVFPVHPNPNVRSVAERILAARERVWLTEPMNYPDFVHLMSRSWLIVSDSGGVQEEVPSLGKPVLVMRENTERPEAVEAGFSRLVGGSPDRLLELLEEAHSEGGWADGLTRRENPFGQGDSGRRIVEAILAHLECDEGESSLG